MVNQSTPKRRDRFEPLDPGVYTFELVVDDGSRDGGFDAARDVADALSVPLRIVRSEPNRGKGGAVRAGMLEALKARNALYRGMLAFFVRMGRLPRRQAASCCWW